jgi:hypothetical protein
MSTLTVKTIEGFAENSNVVSLSAGHVIYSPGSIVQVVSVVKTDTFTTTTTAASGGVVVTGLSASITPKKTTSKILVMAMVNVAGTSTTTQVYSWLARGSTKIGVGAAAGSRVTVGGRFYLADNNVSGMINMTFLDSPATISTTTYNVYIGTQTASGSVVVNRTINDTDNTTDGARSASTLTLMEVAQ